MYQPAMQNGATLLDIAEIMTLDNVSEIKNRLEKIEAKRLEQQQQMMEQQQQSEMQSLQIQQQIKQDELAIREQEMLLEKYKIDADNETKIVIAEIGAYRFQQDLDANNNSIPDPMEIADNAIKRSQLQANIMDKEMSLAMKQSEMSRKAKTEERKISAQEKDIQNKSKIERMKLDLERQKMKHEKSLQKMKDDAAIEREKIKARTAIKNKVAGEK
jgi:hypothetical protein